MHSITYRELKVSIFGNLTTEVFVTNSDEVEKNPERQESQNRDVSEREDGIFDIDAYLDNAQTTTVGKLLGSPFFRDVSEVPDTELDAEVDPKD